MNKPKVLLGALAAFAIGSFACFEVVAQGERKHRDCCKDLLQLEAEISQPIDSVKVRHCGRTFDLILDPDGSGGEPLPEDSGSNEVREKSKPASVSLGRKWIGELAWSPKSEPCHLSVSYLTQGKWSSAALPEKFEAAQAVRNGCTIHLELGAANTLKMNLSP